MRSYKTKPTVFPLTKQAGRIGLLAGIAAGTVTRAELEFTTLLDTEKRPYRKPVVADGIRYESVTDAAVSILGKTKSKRYSYAKRMDAMRHRIAAYCNADNVEGFYWSE